MSRARRLGPVGAASSLLAGVAMAGSVWAQSAQEESVAGRALTDFEPIGLQLGSFLLHAGLTTETEYNDNVFRDQSKASDAIARLKPSLGLAGEFYDATVGVNATADIGRHRELGSENYEDFNLTASLRQDVTEESNFGLGLRYARIHELRGTINDPGRAFGPTQYNLATVTFNPQASQSPFVMTPKIEGRYFDYLPNGPIDNRDRSNYQLFASNRFGYQFDPGWTVFVEPSYEIHSFVKRVDRSGLNRDTQIYQALVGFTYDATADLFVDLGAGYFYQGFFTPRQRNLGGVSFQGSFVWNLDASMSLTGTLGHSTQDVQPSGQALSTSLAGATSSETSSAALRLDYQADDNILAHVGTTLSQTDYGGIPVTEHNGVVSLGVVYYFNEYLSTEAEYGFELQDSPVPTRRFDANRIIFRVTGHI